MYKSAITDIEEGGWGGLNDHTFVVDREHADVMLRAPIEDYYLNTSASGTHFGSSESLLKIIAQAYHIPVHFLTVCDLPLVPLRGLRNSTHWNEHGVYTQLYEPDAAQHGCDDGVLTTNFAPIGADERIALLAQQS